MRIRKRKVPLPFSSLSPIPLTDPCFARFMPPLFAADSQPPPDPIHLDAPPISPAALNLKLQAAGDIDGEKVIITDDDEEGRNDFREKGIVGAHVLALPPPTSSSSSFLVAPHTDQEIKAVKKRSSPWGWGGTSEVRMDMINQEEIVEQDEDEEGRSSGNNIIIKTTTTTSALVNTVRKRGGRGGGGALMEGSRCSRVNGRGWRCCQPTLVGYSLCEHHLGKGRLRSITTTSTTVRVGATQKKHQKHHHYRHRPASIEDQTSMMMISTTKLPPPRRRSSPAATKLGMVKARSISSLLDQTTDQTTKQHLPFFSNRTTQ